MRTCHTLLVPQEKIHNASDQSCNTACTEQPERTLTPLRPIVREGEEPDTVIDIQTCSERNQRKQDPEQMVKVNRLVKKLKKCNLDQVIKPSENLKTRTTSNFFKI